jgi:hypothetical protein
MTDGASIMNNLTTLERAILEEYFHRFKDVGFPNADAFRVVARNNTGAGRFTHLSHSGVVHMPDGVLPLGKCSQINLNDFTAGASFWLEVERGIVKELEIVINGDQDWNGEENSWSIFNPDNAENFIRQS